MGEWEKFETYDDAEFVVSLKNEYPQTTALILSKLSPEKRGKLLSLMEPRLSAEVFKRLYRMQAVRDKVSAIIILEMESVFRKHKRKQENIKIVKETASNIDSLIKEECILLVSESDNDIAEAMSDAK